MVDTKMEALPVSLWLVKNEIPLLVLFTGIFEQLNNSTLISKHNLFLHSYVFSTGMEELSNGVMKADECAISRPLSIKERKDVQRLIQKISKAR